MKSLARPAALITRARFGHVVILAFLFTQTWDGACTYLGIKTFGIEIEANPIVAWYVVAFGVGGAIIFVKGLAVACAAALHVHSRHWTLAALTLLYVFGAIWPWTQLLASRY